MADNLTEKDLQRLPLRAIVALCTRCASRLRHEFDLPGNISDRGRVMGAVDAAIRMARDFAADQPVPNNALDIVNAAMSAAGKAPANMYGTPATDAGMAALVALTIHDGQIDLVPNRARMCVEGVGRAAFATRADYDRLLELGLGPFPELGQPVDVSESGPLGPLWSEDPA